MSDLPVNITGNVPDKTMGRLGEALADLISPITETTGLIGDSIRHHREQMAQRRIAAAQKKAEQLRLEIKPAPYKFIAGWLEGATLENEDSPLNDLWENLLLIGITNYQAYLEMFVSILRELGGSEVKVLKHLADHYSMLDRGSGLVPSKSEADEFPTIFHKIVNSDDDPGQIWIKMEESFDKTKKTDFQLLGATFYEDGSKFHFYYPLYQENFVAFELLARERLIDVNYTQANAYASTTGRHPRRAVEVVTARLTQLGMSFARACMHPEQFAPQLS